MSTEHKAVQLRERDGRPVIVKGSAQIGTDVKGKKIWKSLTCELWELDGYETVIPQGYVPYYDEKKGRWLSTPIGSEKDPSRQLGFIRDDDIQF